MQSLNKKTVKFYTVGCKVNQYETQAIREQFEKSGFQELNDSIAACVCVVNTCTVTHRADRSSIYLIHRALRQNPGAQIIVCGCLAEFDFEKISSISGVGFVVKNKDKTRIVSLLHENVDNIDSGTDTPTSSRITYFKNHSRAFVKIQDGCNYNCSYCKVRQVRGVSYSRTLCEIKNEITTLVRNGYKEIVLSGVCLGSFGRDLTPESNLSELIMQLERIQGNFRIRLSSIEANDVTDTLLNVIKKSARVCSHLHIPVQSGDEQILKKMNRAYTAGNYIKLIERIRELLPDIAITTDVMVGFPGETEDCFKNTIELIKRIRPLRVHTFPYSKRLSTVAYNFKEIVADSQIKSRLSILMDISQQSRFNYCQMFIGKVCQVLIEKKISHDSESWEGYTDNYIRVRVNSKDNLKNRLIPLRLKSIYKDFVLADII